jgi:formylglycine-generating enzyme required for sulfatase activity
MAHDVFISHSNHDKAVADAMCSRLEQAGIRCWIAPRDVRPGRNWGSEIIRGLDNAKVMIVVLSANANDSRPVMKEVERAFGKGIVIIPVRTEDVLPSHALEFFLSSEHWLDAITPPLEAHIDRLARTVKEYLVEEGWTGATGSAVSSVTPPATAEQLSKGEADKTGGTDAASGAVPSRVQEQSVGIPESVREETASTKEATEKTEEQDAPPAQMELRPPRHERSPLLYLLQTPKARVIFAACAGVVIVAVALIVMLSQRQTNPTKEHPFVNSLDMRFVSVPGTNVLFSVWETRVKDYQAFCDATGRSWEKPKFQQTPEHPAVNVNWEDAKAFCEWLSRKEGKKYRLPTDHEWSCAVGIGDRENADATPKSKDMKIADVFPWGRQWPPPNDAGNYFGEECKTAAGLVQIKAAGYGYGVSSWEPGSWGPVIEGFNDGKVLTAAAGSFAPNGLGIYDQGGNVWEWCQDEYEPGSPSRVMRGGSWNNGNRDYVLSSGRYYYVPDFRYGAIGFRVAVEAGFGR